MQAVRKPSLREHIQMLDQLGLALLFTLGVAAMLATGYTLVRRSLHNHD